MTNVPLCPESARLPVGLPDSFFDRDAQVLAQALLGKARSAIASVTCG